MCPSVDNDLFRDFVCHTFSFIQKQTNKKKINALGKISARADDKPGYFFKWQMYFLLISIKY